MGTYKIWPNIKTHTRIQQSFFSQYKDTTIYVNDDTLYFVGEALPNSCLICLPQIILLRQDILKYNLKIIICILN